MIGVVLLATLHRRLLRWHGLVGVIVVVVLFVPVGRYRLHGNLPVRPRALPSGRRSGRSLWLTALLIDPRVRLRSTAFDRPILLIAGWILASDLANPGRVNAYGSFVAKTLTFYFSFWLVYYITATTIRRRASVRLLLKLLAGGRRSSGLSPWSSVRAFNVFDHLHRLLPFLTFDRVSTAPFCGVAICGCSGLPSIQSRSGPCLSCSLRSRCTSRALVGAVGRLRSASPARRALQRVAHGGHDAPGAGDPLSHLQATRDAASSRCVRHRRGTTASCRGRSAASRRRSSPRAASLPSSRSSLRTQTGSWQAVGSDSSADDRGGEPSPALRRRARYTHHRLRREHRNAPILDNQWLNNLLDVGYVGLGLWLWLFVPSAPLRRPDKQSAKTDSWLFAGLAASIFSFAIGMLTFDAFGFTQIFFVFWILWESRRRCFRRRSDPGAGEDWRTCRRPGSSRRRPVRASERLPIR